MSAVPWRQPHRAHDGGRLQAEDIHLLIKLCDYVTGQHMTQQTGMFKPSRLDQSGQEAQVPVPAGSDQVRLALAYP